MYLNGPAIQKSIILNYDPNNIYDQKNYMMNLFQEIPRNFTTLENILIQQNEIKYGGNLMKIINTRL